MKYRKTIAGNYLGRYRKFYVFIHRRPHGKWCCRISDGEEWLWREGYFGTYLSTLKKAKDWAWGMVSDKAAYASIKKQK